MAQTFRHEYKHFINQGDILSLRTKLRQVAKNDQHADPNGTYTVHSLYFDNLNDKVLREKLDGLNAREKFRIRYYNENRSFILLEKKSKINGFCLKQSTGISEEECMALLNGRLDWMRDSSRPLLMELYAKMRYQLLRPRTQVGYLREAYVYEPGGVRITLDSHIRTGTCLGHSLTPDISISAGEQIILEVKYDAFLPEIIAGLLQERYRETSAFSKYAACRASTV